MGMQWPLLSDSITAGFPVQSYDAETMAAMKRVTEYFGEDWDANDPSRVLRIVRDFMNLFDKSMAEIEVRASVTRCLLTPPI